MDPPEEVAVLCSILCAVYGFSIVSLMEEVAVLCSVVNTLEGVLCPPRCHQVPAAPNYNSLLVNLPTKRQRGKTKTFIWNIVSTTPKTKNL